MGKDIIAQINKLGAKAYDMKTIKITSFILTSFLLVTCQKRPFAHVELHGRIVNAATNQPLQAKIQLWVGGSSPGSKGTSEYGITRTNGDGSFDIKSNAQWHGSDYTIIIFPDSSLKHSVISKSFQISRNQNLDVGTIGL